METKIGYVIVGGTFVNVFFEVLCQMDYKTINFCLKIFCIKYTYGMVNCCRHNVLLILMVDLFWVYFGEAWEVSLKFKNFNIVNNNIFL